MLLSDPEPFRKQIAYARELLRRYLHTREVVDQRITDIRQLIKSNANFLPPAERAAELAVLEIFRTPTTIAEAVRLALYVGRARQERMTTVQIKKCAEEHGFDFSEYNNPMATIHTILRNMRDSDPPEVGYDEAAKSYSLLTKFPKEMIKTMAERLVEMRSDAAYADIDRALEIMFGRTEDKLKINFDKDSKH